MFLGPCVRLRRSLKTPRFQWVASGGANAQCRVDRSLYFRTRWQTTGWPKDKHSLSTRGKVFPCKCLPLGLAHLKTNKPLILLKLKPVDQQKGLWITRRRQRRAGQTHSGAFGKRQEPATPKNSLLKRQNLDTIGEARWLPPSPSRTPGSTA